VRADLVTLEHLQEWEVRDCLALLGDDVDVGLEAEALLDSVLDDGVGGEFAELDVYDCDLFRGGLVELDDLHDALCDS